MADNATTLAPTSRTPPPPSNTPAPTSPPSSPNAGGSLQCPSPEEIVQGYISSYTEERLVYECHVGHDPEAGDFVRECVDGAWSGTHPRCTNDDPTLRGQLIGGIVGGVSLLFLVILVLDFIRQRRKKSKTRRHIKRTSKMDDNIRPTSFFISSGAYIPVNYLDIIYRHAFNRDGELGEQHVTKRPPKGVHCDINGDPLQHNIGNGLPSIKEPKKKSRKQVFPSDNDIYGAIGDSHLDSSVATTQSFSLEKSNKKKKEKKKKKRQKSVDQQSWDNMAYQVENPYHNDHAPLHSNSYPMLPYANPRNPYGVPLQVHQSRVYGGYGDRNPARAHVAYDIIPPPVDRMSEGAYF